MLLREGVVGKADFSIFWRQNNYTHADARKHLRFRSIKDYVLHGIEQLPEKDLLSPETTLNGILSLFIDPFVCNAYGYLQRHTCPASPWLYDRDLFDDDTLFRDIREVQQLKRQVSSFVLQDGSVPPYPFLRSACRILEDLCQDLQQLQSLQRSTDGGNANERLRELIQEQTEESQESLRTSVQVGRLSRLAYLFLPLQLTTSILGMNLEVFGAGSLAVYTFFSILGLLCTFSFLPIALPEILPLEILSRWRSAQQYSRRVAYLYVLFYFTHGKSLNDSLWGCGISYDIGHFQGRRRRRDVTGPGWKSSQDRLLVRLKEERLSFFPQFWQERVKEIFEIIDKPQWGREKSHQP